MSCRGLISFSYAYTQASSVTLNGRCYSTWLLSILVVPFALNRDGKCDEQGPYVMTAAQLTNSSHENGEQVYRLPYWQALRSDMSRTASEVGVLLDSI